MVKSFTLRSCTMIWIRRLFFLPALALLAIILSYLAGYQALPSAGYEWGLILALGGGLALLVLLRFFAVTALGLSLFFGLALFVAVSLLAHYFFFERQRDRWFNNQNEQAIQLPAAKENPAYLRSLGIEPAAWPPLNWLNHTRVQTSTGLSSQQLGAGEVGTPIPVKTEQEIWLGWLGQLMMLFSGLVAGVLFGHRRHPKPQKQQVKGKI
ncbi:MAG: hypothetical protein ACJAYE_001894 [Candidatus Azotimanducaceae bacterium]|jgi:hypothetical protein